MTMLKNDAILLRDPAIPEAVWTLGEEVEGISVHYSHLVRNFLPSVVWCTRDESQKGQRPPGCYRVHMPFRKLREKHVLGMVQEATSKVRARRENPSSKTARVSSVFASGRRPPKVVRPPARSKSFRRVRQRCFSQSRTKPNSPSRPTTPR